MIRFPRNTTNLSLFLLDGFNVVHDFVHPQYALVQCMSKSYLQGSRYP